MVTGVERRLGPKTRRRLGRAAAPAGLSVSAISAFEIAALNTAGRLLFTQPVDRWIRESIAAAALRVLDLEPGIAVDAGLIPAGALADPIDRLLVATAREYQLPLVTCDRRVLDYAGRTGLVRVVDAAE